MKKKEYKIKVENGEIKFLDPFDLTKSKEGIIIFFDEDLEHKKEGMDSLLDLSGTINAKPKYKELTPELIDSVVYDEL